MICGKWLTRYEAGRIAEEESRPPRRALGCLHLAIGPALWAHRHPLLRPCLQGGTQREQAMGGAV
jgi:hypothetical protein